MTEMKEVVKNVMWALDKLDDMVMQRAPYRELELVSGLLLSYSANLDPERTIPEPPTGLTLDEVIEMLKEEQR